MVHRRSLQSGKLYGFRRLKIQQTVTDSLTLDQMGMALQEFTSCESSIQTSLKTIADAVKDIELMRYNLREEQMHFVAYSHYCESTMVNNSRMLAEADAKIVSLQKSIVEVTTKYVVVEVANNSNTVGIPEDHPFDRILDGHSDTHGLQSASESLGPTIAATDSDMGPGVDVEELMSDYWTHCALETLNPLIDGSMPAKSFETNPDAGVSQGKVAAHDWARVSIEDLLTWLESIGCHIRYAMQQGVVDKDQLVNLVRGYLEKGYDVGALFRHC